MKTKFAALLLSLTWLSTSAFAQGPLIPPGPPGSPLADMPSLKQVKEAALACRKEIPAGTVTVQITAPGSYVLCGNLTVATGDGILIKSDCVTLDLNGFCISSSNPARTGAGITVEGPHADVTIRNGHITGAVVYDPQNTGAPWSGNGFADGINLRPDGVNFADNVNIDTITVSRVGRHGIYCGEAVVVNSNTPPVIAVSVSSNVRDCSIRLCGGAGIVATNVVQCVARQTFVQGIVGHSAANCSASSYTSDGIVAYTASNCYGTSDGAGRGVAGHQSLNCVGSSQTGYGLEAFNATNCQGTSASSRGLFADTATNCQGTSVSSYGLWATVATGSVGTSTTGPGINALRLVSHCSGKGKPGITSPMVSHGVGEGLAGTAAIQSQKAFGCYSVAGIISATEASDFNTVAP